MAEKEQNMEFKLLSTALIMLALVAYWLNFFEIIPDFAGLIGFLDEVIVTILAINLIVKIKREGPKAIKSFIAHPFEALDPVTSKILTPKFLFSVMITGGVLWYIFTEFDGIPDFNPILGRVDDIGVALLGLVGLINLSRGGISKLFGGKQDGNR